MDDCILTTECLVIILILIFFSFHKHFRLDGIFLLGKQSLFLSEITTPNLFASIKPPINEWN